MAGSQRPPTWNMPSYSNSARYTYHLCMCLCNVNSISFLKNSFHVKSVQNFSKYFLKFENYFNDTTFLKYFTLKQSFINIQYTLNVVIWQFVVNHGFHFCSVLNTKNDVFSGSSKNLESWQCLVSVQRDPQDVLPHPFLWQLPRYHALGSLLSLKHHKQPLLKLWSEKTYYWLCVMSKG